jgi:hypothetical protein
MVGGIEWFHSNLEREPSAGKADRGVLMGLGRIVIVAFLMFGPATAVRADPSPSVCRDGFCFSESDKVAGAPLVLRGVSTFRYWGFRVYTGALYLPASEASPTSALGEVPKKLVLRYHRSVSVDQFVEKSEETLEKHPQLSLKQLRPFLSTMQSLYVPVEEGDSCAVTYEPAQGTLRLFFNDRLLGQITDRSFARAYFGIWVSEYSVSDDFTDELLGREL